MTARTSAVSGPVDLLLRCLSPQGEPAPASAAWQYAPGDWNEVADVAVRHAVAPLLFARLKRSEARARVPAAAWERLRRAYFSSARGAMRLRRKLGPVLGGLRNAGIPTVVLKGAYLAEAVYGDVALRPVGDVDLMVPRAESLRAQRVLLDMGGVQYQSADLDSHCGETVHLPSVVFRDLIVEIHNAIATPAGPVRIDVDALWDRARPATIAGVGVLALSPEDLLLHLCLHFSQQHRLETGLRFLCDVTEAVRRFGGEIDWTQVVRSAREWGAARHVALTLYLVKSMLGSGVPDDVQRYLIPGERDLRVLELARESVAAQMHGRRYVSRSVRDLWGEHSIGDKLKLLWKRLFTSRAELATMYPSSRNSRCWCLYYALRLRDVLRLHGASVPRIVRSRAVRQGASKMVAVLDWLGQADSGQPNED